MKALQHLISQCPPYLTFLTVLGGVVSFGLFKLYGVLQTVGL